MTGRLYRSRTDTVIGGVAAGLAKYLNTDPALVRIAWAILALMTAGGAVIVYLVAWIAIPEEPRIVAPPTVAGLEGEPATTVEGEPAPEWATTEPARADSSRAGIVVGLGLVLLGLWFLARQYLPAFDWGLIWPIAIVGVGVVILVNASRRTT